MALLHPGDTFPPLTLNIPAGQAIEVPGWFAGEFGVVLFNRGAWCPYCTAQLRAFQRAGGSLTQAGIQVAALWVDDEKTTAEFTARHGIGRALAFGQAGWPTPCYATGVVTPPGAPGGKNVADGEANVSRQSFNARSERGRNDD